MKAAGIAVLLAAALAGCARLGIVPDRYYPIDGRRAVELAGDAEAVIDLRPPAAYDQGHVPGAVSIPLSQLWIRMDELPQEYSAVILLYEDDPDRLLRGVQRLRSEGYYRLHALEGGFAAWRAAGGQVSYEPAPPPGHGRGVETW